MGREARSPGQGRSAGFTLVEVLIAMVVLSIASLGAASTLIGVINGNNISKRVAVATTLGQDKLEELKSLPFTHADLADTNAGNNADADLRSTTVVEHQDPKNPLTPVGAGSYTRVWNVAENVAGQGTKTVAVIVQWEAGSRTRSMVFTTIKAQ